MVVTGPTRNRFALLGARHGGSNPSLSVEEEKLRGYSERCPSWPKEHDWKSCIPTQIGIAGSNPALSVR